MTLLCALQDYYESVFINQQMNFKRREAEMQRCWRRMLFLRGWFCHRTRQQDYLVYCHERISAIVP